MRGHARTIIVGGGVVGLCCAVLLGRVGHSVTVMDFAPAIAPSWNNAGHIATEQVTPIASLATLRSVAGRLFVAGGPVDFPLRQMGAWLPFALRLVAAARPARFEAGSTALRGLLRDAMPAWLRMAEALGHPALVREGGHLIAWDSAGGAVRGRRSWQDADTGTAIGRVTSPDDQRLLALLLGTSPAGAMRFDGTGQIADLDTLARALRNVVTATGGTIVEERAHLRWDGSRATVPGRPADAILVAGGVGSGALMQSLGHRAPVVAERGYHIRASAEHWPVDAPPVVFEDRSMIVTRYADQVQAASFAEFAASDAPPDLRKWERLERHVRELGLPMRPPFTRWMGARPTLPDYLPAIGRSTHADNVFYAFGHQHLGLTLAPVTAEAVVALMTGRVPAIDLAPFDIARFDQGKRA